MKNKITTRLVVGLVAFGCVLASNASLSMLGNVTDNGGGSYTISSGIGSVPDANIESWIGLPAGQLDSMAVTTNPNLVTEGSALKQTAAMAAGDTLSFDWVWESDETTAGQPAEFADFAFYSLTFQGATYLVDRFAPNGTSGSFSWVAPTAGTMTLGIGVVDVGDYDFDSRLGISNTVIPEPGTFSLIGAVAAGFIFVRRRFVR
jgi:hypothetical protein